MDPMIQMAFGDVQTEIANLRKMIAAMPESQFGFQSKPKSGALGQIAQHVVDLVGLGTVILDTTEFDVLQPRPKNDAPTTNSLLQKLDENAATLEARLATLAPADLGVQWTFRAGDHVIFAIPRGLALRSFCISHLIHHRAQLGVYLRLTDNPVPGMYGPSADER